VQVSKKLKQLRVDKVGLDFRIREEAINGNLTIEIPGVNDARAHFLSVSNLQYSVVHFFFLYGCM
jgi:hypothetical protein